MFHGHLEYFQKPSLGCRPNTKPGDYDTMNSHNHLFILFVMYEDPAWIEISIEIAFSQGSHHTWLHTTFEGMRPRYMVLEVSWGRCLDNSFKISQSHGHGSWLVNVKWPLGAILHTSQGPWPCSLIVWALKYHPKAISLTWFAKNCIIYLLNVGLTWIMTDPEALYIIYHVRIHVDFSLFFFFLLLLF